MRYLRTAQPLPTLVDSCILIDLLANDAKWADWSLDQLARLGSQAVLVINPIILAEVSPRFERAADLETALADLPLVREALPWDAAFLAGQAFKVYRQSQGANFTAGPPQGEMRTPWGAGSYTKCATVGANSSPMPDFYIGAHALVGGMQLLTRDAARYRSYFPNLPLVAP
ncbi:MAG: DNA-binding protein [Burkholderiales bacterium PBB3]|nr:MAG: DNA-binding protein [Burkholderiales bacterium PBB3]